MQQNRRAESAIRRGNTLCSSMHAEYLSFSTDAIQCRRNTVCGEDYSTTRAQSSTTHKKSSHVGRAPIATIATIEPRAHWPKYMQTIAAAKTPMPPWLIRGWLPVGQSRRNSPCLNLFQIPCIRTILSTFQWACVTSCTCQKAFRIGLANTDPRKRPSKRRARSARKTCPSACEA